MRVCACVCVHSRSPFPLALRRRAPWFLLQVIASWCRLEDVAPASLVCRAWRAAFSLTVTRLHLPLSHPLLLAGPPPHAPAPQYGGSAPGASGSTSECGAGGQQAGEAAAGAGPSSSSSGHALAKAQQQARPSLPSLYGPAHPSLLTLATAFPNVKSLVLMHNTMLHRQQARAALSAVRALWPAVSDLCIQDCVSWDFPLDYEALGAMTHLTSLGLLFQGQGGMDEAGQPMYRSGMLHLCRLRSLRSLTMKWIIGYDVDSFLDFEEVRVQGAMRMTCCQARSANLGGAGGTLTIH